MVVEYFCPGTVYSRTSISGVSICGGTSISGAIF